MPEASVRMPVCQLLFRCRPHSRDLYIEVKHHTGQRMVGVQRGRLLANCFHNEKLGAPVRRLRLQLHAHRQILDS